MKCKLVLSFSILLIIIRGDLRKEYINANAAFDEIQVARKSGERWKSMTDEVSVGLSLFFLINHWWTLISY
jgi:hypothetical protein